MSSSLKVKRRTAVELLEESKPYYVKPDKNMESATYKSHPVHIPTSFSFCSSNTSNTLPPGGGRCFRLPSMSASICSVCYYSHAIPSHHLHHLGPFGLSTLQESNRHKREKAGHLCDGNNGGKHRRSSVPSSTGAAFQIHSLQMNGIAMTLGGFVHSATSLFTPVEKAQGPECAKLKQGKVDKSDKSPSPNKPLTSPKTPNKPNRPNDFPEWFKKKDEEENSTTDIFPKIQPPPPPAGVDLRDHHHHKGISGKILLREKRLHSNVGDIGFPLALPSPILPPTPPLDIIMDSPMSDSGPIISPPPAFSTPVTPMIDRQTIPAHQTQSLEKLTQLSNSITGSSSAKVLASKPSDGPRHSLESISATTRSSSSTPRSDEGGDDGDNSDDSSDKYPVLPARLKKLATIPKSITENTLSLSRIHSFDAGMKGNRQYVDTLPSQHSMSSQTDTLGSIASPLRRPILRSKSDLSHRYKRTSIAENFIGGGELTLIHLDWSTGSKGRPVISQEYPSLNIRGRDSRRASRSSVELERFFDTMGLETVDGSLPPVISTGEGSSLFEPRGHGPLLPSSGSSSPIFFSSLSSVDSIGRNDGSMESLESPKDRSLTTRNGCSGYLGVLSSNSQGTPNLMIAHGEPSIVERNARVIKWLFNCRKAVESRVSRR